MRKFLAGKLTFLLSVMLGLVLFVFILFVTLPSPEQILTGQRSDKATTDAIVRDLGLDKPKWHQFGMYLNDLSPISIYQKKSSIIEKSNAIRVVSISSYTLVLKWPYLRTSFQSKLPVTSIIASAFVGTLILAFAAILIALLIGIPLGVFASIRQGSKIDTAIVAFSTIGVSVPSFFSALLFAWLFGFVLKEYTGLSMVGSLWEVDDLGEGRVVAWKNLILPAVSLGIRPLSVFIQLTRNTMVDVLSQDFIRTARAKGLSERKVIWKHAFMNALNPLVTSVGGWLSSLLAGAFFTEYIFNWKGLGKVAIDALQQSDLPVIMGTVLFTACMFFVINIFTELVYFWLDPRINHEG